MIQDVEQRRRFLARLRPKIQKLCVVRTFIDIEELVDATTKLEKVLGELGETPYEPLKEEQEEGASETMMGK
jgi:predicted RNA-binding protein